MCICQDRTSQQQSSVIYTYVGENIAAETGLANYTQLVQLWNDEFVNYNYSTMSCTPGKHKECGHYTQVLWLQNEAFLRV